MKNKSIYLSALKLISRKDYSEVELKNRLTSVYANISDTELNQTIEELKNKRYLDDFELAYFIVEKFLTKKKGYHYIISVLKYKQIKEEAIKNIKENFDYRKEFEIAKKFFTEKVKNRSSLQVLRMLSRRGFSFTTLDKVSEHFFIPEGE